MTILRPSGGRLVVRKCEAEAISKGGIVIPDTVKQEPVFQAIVVAIGPEEMTESGDSIPFIAGANRTPIAVGDKVLYAGSSGLNMKVADVEYTTLSFSDILHVAVELDPNHAEAAPWHVLEEVEA